MAKIVEDFNLSLYEEQIKDNIEDHPLLDWFKFKQISNLEDKNINDIELISNKWETVKPINFWFTSNQEILKKYEDGKIDENKLSNELSILKLKKKYIEEKIEALWWEYIDWSYESIHWYHKIDLLVPKELKLNKDVKYKTDNTLSLERDDIVYIGDYWDKSLFFTIWYSYWEFSYRGFSCNEYLFSLDDKNNLYFCKIDWENFDFYYHDWHLLLSESTYNYFNKKQINSLNVLVNPDWWLSEKLFKQIKVNASEFEIKKNWSKISEILGLENVE
jgi:hypothetical protein